MEVVEVIADVLLELEPIMSEFQKHQSGFAKRKTSEDDSSTVQQPSLATLLPPATSNDTRGSGTKPQTDVANLEQENSETTLLTEMGHTVANMTENVNAYLATQTREDIHKIAPVTNEELNCIITDALSKFAKKKLDESYSKLLEDENLFIKFINEAETDDSSASKFQDSVLYQDIVKVQNIRQENKTEQERLEAFLEISVADKLPKVVDECDKIPPVQTLHEEEKCKQECYAGSGLRTSKTKNSKTGVNKQKPAQKTFITKRVKRVVKKRIKYSPSNNWKPKSNAVSPQMKILTQKRLKITDLCFCGEGKGGRMVQCSNINHCDKMWYHFEGPNPCVDYDAKLFNYKNWYCPSCIKQDNEGIERSGINKADSEKYLSEADLGKPKLKESYSEKTNEPSSSSDEKNSGSFDENIEYYNNDNKSLKERAGKDLKDESNDYENEEIENIIDDFEMIIENESINTNLADQNLTTFQEETDSLDDFDIQVSERWNEFKSDRRSLSMLLKKENNNVDIELLKSKPLPESNSEDEIIAPIPRLSLDKIIKAKGISSNTLQFVPPSRMSIVIPRKEWRKTYDKEQNRLRSHYPQIIHDRLQEMNFPCSFVAKDYYPLKKRGTFTIRGRCGGKGCNIQFKCTVPAPTKNQDTKIKIAVSGKFRLVQQESSGRPLRGKERRATQKRLKHSSALKEWLTQQVIVDDKQFLHKNLRTKSLNVLRTAKSEAFVKSRVKKTDIISDCQNLAKEMFNEAQYVGRPILQRDGFIQSLSAIPFGVSIYCPLQIQYGELTNIWHLDATGSVCGLPYVDSKRILLHSLIAKIEDTDIQGVPIFEVLLNDNSGTELGNRIKTFVSDLRKIDPKYQPHQVTVDFSFAYLHACSEGINVETLMDNINRSYDCMLSGLDNPDNKTRIQICQNHLLHAFSRNLTRHAVPAPIKRLGMHAVAKLMEIETQDQLKQTLSQIISIFGSEKLPLEIANSFAHDLMHGSMLQPLEKQMSEFYFTLKTDEELHDFSIKGDEKLQREQSKYFQMFKQRVDEITESNKTECKDCELNPYYNLKVLNVLAKHYIPYYPLWSNCCPTYPLLGESKGSNNGCVERYFGVHKNNLHMKSKEYVPQYIKEHGPMVVGMVNNVLQKAMEPTNCKMKSTKQVRDKIDPLDENNVKPFQVLKKVDNTTSFGSQERWNKSNPNAKKQPLYVKRNLKSYFQSSNVLETIEEETPFKVCSRLKRRLKASKKLFTSPKESPKKKTLKGSKPKISEISKVYMPQQEVSEDITAKAAEDRTTNKNDTVFLVEESEGVELDPKCAEGKLASLNSLFLVNGTEGHECDLVTLSGEKWLNDAVMHAYAELLISQPRVVPNSKNEVIGKSFIITRTVDMKTNKSVWTESLACLQNKKNFNSQEGVMYVISHNVNHWWLMKCDFANSVIESYDSGLNKKLVDPKIKFEHIQRLKKAFEKKYDKPVKEWKFKEVTVPQQPGCYECGPLTLLALDHLLQGTSVDFIDPGRILEYKQTIAKNLLLTTEKGIQLLNKFDNDIERTLDKLNTRQTYRSLTEKIKSQNNKLMNLLGGILNVQGDEKLHEIDKCLDNIKMQREKIVSGVSEYEI